ncbi:hydrolase [Streptomyces sulfonofaciens]|uniref:Hydrolase n=1 Tax=Streptomyces sulfonofaciens TaxID=68272 RepID=A0A919GSY8_9ACTN|nr:carbon-nitrogen hydrolase family protein [Streptomyces sulfonofaciens]GHH88950.1 hydrolase [Streptomyces sulfonofaciens]
MSTLHVALLQSQGCPGSVPANLELLDAEAGKAAAADCDLLVTPELFLTGYGVGEALPRLADEAREAGSEVDRIAALHRIAIVCGLPEAAGGVLYNAARLTGPDGAPLAHYRKTHLWGPYERAWFTPGDLAIAQARLRGVTVGLLICYDVEFPEAVRAHALAGTDLLAVPTALPRTGAFVAETLVPARAFESQLHIAYANRTGTEGGFDFAGLSTLAGPGGRPGPRAGSGTELLLGHVDTDTLAASRTAHPYLADHRPDLYTARRVSGRTAPTTAP